MTHDYSLAAPVVFSDFDLATGISLCEQFLRAHSLRSFSDKLTYAGYKDLPPYRTVYIKTLKDVCVLPDLQDSFIANLRKNEKEGEVQVVEINFDHAPPASGPKELADVVRNVVEKMG